MVEAVFSRGLAAGRLRAAGPAVEQALFLAAQPRAEVLTTLVVGHRLIIPAEAAVAGALLVAVAVPAARPLT